MAEADTTRQEQNFMVNEDFFVQSVSLQKSEFSMKDLSAECDDLRASLQETETLCEKLKKEGSEKENTIQKLRAETDAWMMRLLKSRQEMNIMIKDKESLTKERDVVKKAHAELLKQLGVGKLGGDHMLLKAVVENMRKTVCLIARAARQGVTDTRIAESLRQGLSDLNSRNSNELRLLVRALSHEPGVSSTAHRKLVKQPAEKGEEVQRVFRQQLAVAFELFLERVIMKKRNRVILEQVNKLNRMIAHLHQDLEIFSKDLEVSFFFDHTELSDHTGHEELNQYKEVQKLKNETGVTPQLQKRRTVSLPEEMDCVTSELQKLKQEIERLKKETEDLPVALALRYDNDLDLDAALSEATGKFDAQVQDEASNALTSDIAIPSAAVHVMLYHRRSVIAEVVLKGMDLPNGDLESDSRTPVMLAQKFIDMLKCRLPFVCHQELGNLAATSVTIGGPISKALCDLMMIMTDVFYERKTCHPRDPGGNLYRDGEELQHLREQMKHMSVFLRDQVKQQQAIATSELARRTAMSKRVFQRMLRQQQAMAFDLFAQSVMTTKMMRRRVQRALDRTTYSLLAGAFACWRIVAYCYASAVNTILEQRERRTMSTPRHDLSTNSSRSVGPEEVSPQKSYGRDKELGSKTAEQFKQTAPQFNRTALQSKNARGQRLARYACVSAEDALRPSPEKGKTTDIQAHEDKKFVIGGASKSLAGGRGRGMDEKVDCIHLRAFEQRRSVTSEPKILNNQYHRLNSTPTSDSKNSAQKLLARSCQRSESPTQRDVAGVLRAAFDDVPAGLTGWFLDKDSDATGYLSLNELYDDLLQLSTGLTPHQILEFLTYLIDRNDRITLSRMWAAIKCPDLQDGGASSSLEALAPNLTQSQFEADVLDMSRTAAQQLRSIARRNICLQQKIKALL